MTINQIILSVFLGCLPKLAQAKEPHSEKRAQAREILEQVREINPERYERLIRLRKDNPQAFRHALRRASQVLGPARDDPPFREAKEKTRGLRDAFKTTLEAYNNADADDAAGLRSQLVEIATQIFEAKQADRRQRLEKMDAHLRELEEKIEERADNRDALIEKFVDEKTNQKITGL